MKQEILFILYSNVSIVAFAQPLVAVVVTIADFEFKFARNTSVVDDIGYILYTFIVVFRFVSVRLM